MRFDFLNLVFRQSAKPRHLVRPRANFEFIESWQLSLVRRDDELSNPLHLDTLILAVLI